MLFFRSEEAVDAWCSTQRVERGPSATLDQLWRLAEAWYADRLEPTARRPGSDGIGHILAEVGLEDPAWDPRADDS